MQLSKVLAIPLRVQPWRLEGQRCRRRLRPGRMCPRRTPWASSPRTGRGACCSATRLCRALGTVGAFRKVTVMLGLSRIIIASFSLLRSRVWVEVPHAARGAAGGAERRAEHAALRHLRRARGPARAELRTCTELAPASSGRLKNQCQIVFHKFIFR